MLQPAGVAPGFPLYPGRSTRLDFFGVLDFFRLKAQMRALCSTEAGQEKRNVSSAAL